MRHSLPLAICRHLPEKYPLLYYIILKLILRAEKKELKQMMNQSSIDFLLERKKNVAHSPVGRLLHLLLGARRHDIMSTI
jgi:hypothetical protein